MKALTRLIRSFVKCVFVALLAVLLGLATSTWWLPPVLPLVAGWCGLELGAVTRMAEGRWQLSGLRYTDSELAWSVDQLELPGPQTYLLQRWSGSFSAAAALKIQSVELDLRRAEAPAAEFYPADFLLGFRSSQGAIAAWLPLIEVQSLHVARAGQAAGQLNEFKLEASDWSGAVQLADWSEPLEFSAALDATGPWSASVQFRSLAAEVQLALVASGLELSAQLVAGADRLTASTHLPYGQALPDRGQVETDHFTLNPSDWGFLGGAFGTEFVLQQVRVDWDGARYQGGAQWAGHYATNGAVAEPIRGAVEFFGDWESLTVPTLHGSLGWGEFSLDAPLQLSFRERRVAQSVQMNVALDLAQQPFLSGISGELQGAVLWEPSASAGLDLSFELEGKDLSYGDLVASALKLSGRYRAEALSGRIELQQLAVPQLEPVELTGEYTFQPAGAFSFEGSVRAETAELRAQFKGQVAEEYVTLQLQELDWSDAAGPTWGLVQPAEITYPFGAAAAGAGARLRVTPIQLVDAAGRPRLSLQLEDALRVACAEFSPSRLEPWLQAELPTDLEVDLSLELSQLAPYLQGSLVAELRRRAESAEPLRLSGSVQLAAGGMTVDALDFVFRDAPLVAGELRVPLRFKMPQRGALPYELVAGGLLGGQLRGRTSSESSEWLWQAFGVRLEQAELDLDLSGTLLALEGHFNLAAASIEYAASGWPAIRALRLSGTVDPQRIDLAEFGFSLNQSKVLGAGQLSLAAVRELMRSDARGLDRYLGLGTGRLEFDGWQLSNWTPYLPVILRQTGQLNGSLTLSEDAQLQGELRFKELGLRPTGTFPSVDSIQGRLRLSGRTVSIDSASAQVGGSPVAVRGSVDFSDRASPYWDVQVQGENVPLLRSSKMIVRSDVDLRASHAAGSAEPRLEGRMELRSSTLLVDFDPLASSVQLGPSQSPPYFSIQNPLLADWRFDIELVGDSFMRVRSPYFRAELSADLTLGGRFAEPVLLGSLRSTSGELRFPGARMELERAEAYIAPSNPKVVQLNLAGSAQSPAYVVTMEVLGTLQDPQVLLQSSPALTNAQILRLLATGSLTGGGTGTVGLYLGKGLMGPGGLGDRFADRLKLEVGTAKTRSGRDTVEARYDLSDDWYLEGGYDVYDAYNLDLIWSLFRR
jgi:hypothetical protein